MGIKNKSRLKLSPPLVANKIFSLRSFNEIFSVSDSPHWRQILDTTASLPFVTTSFPLSGKPKINSIAFGEIWSDLCPILMLHPIGSACAQSQFKTYPFSIVLPWRKRLPKPIVSTSDLCLFVNYHTGPNNCDGKHLVCRGTCEEHYHLVNIKIKILMDINLHIKALSNIVWFPHES